MTPSRPHFRVWIAAAVWLLTSAAAALAMIPAIVESPAELASPETRVWDFNFIEIEQRQCSQQVSRGPPLGSYEHTYFVGQSGVWVHNDCKRQVVRRELSQHDRKRIDQGLGIKPKGDSGTVADQVLGKQDTQFISASLTEKGTRRFRSGNGLVEIDVKKAVEGGAKFVDHKNVVQAARRSGDLKAVRDAKRAEEVLFKGEITPEAIKLIRED